MFNESQYPEMIAHGQLVPKYPYLRDDHLKEPEKRGEPQCTHGQMIRYLDNNGRWLVEVFQYRRPNKTLGASGVPDPKRLRVGDTVFKVPQI